MFEIGSRVALHGRRNLTRECCWSTAWSEPFLNVEFLGLVTLEANFQFRIAQIWKAQVICVQLREFEMTMPI